MRVTSLPLPDVLLLEPQVHTDQRGYFYESYNQQQLNTALGLAPHFVQDNHSYSQHGVLRGLHFKLHHPQAKLVRVTHGEIFDVVVDLRPSSTHFGQWTSVYLSAANKKQLWIPEGFAHGFYVNSPVGAEVLYKSTGFYEPEHELCLAWNDPTLAIAWPTSTRPLLSARDAVAPSFAQWCAQQQQQP